MHEIENAGGETMRHRSLTGLALGILLAGCAMPQDPLASALVAPGKYEFYDCSQLTTTAKGLEARLQKYEKLMAKASESAVGGLVNATTYQPEYLSARGDLEDVHRTQRVKGCDEKQDGKKSIPKPPPDLTRRR